MGEELGQLSDVRTKVEMTRYGAVCYHTYVYTQQNRTIIGIADTYAESMKKFHAEIQKEAARLATG